VKAPEAIETARLLLRRPQCADSADIFGRYASDPEVTHFLGWPRHETLADTAAFLDFSERHWQPWPAGPYLIFARSDGSLLGGTGLGFESPVCAATGYVLARDAWGQGYATEALGAMVDLARQLGVTRLYALCHREHRASARVLEKCGFKCEGVHRREAAFPNLASQAPADILTYAMSWKSGPAV